MSSQIKSIVVVGGGTAGWLSAAYLNRAFGHKIDITLIESSLVNPIGVGEATIPTWRGTLEFLGFKDQEWMPEVNATYKAGIKFINWAETPRDGKDAYYWHPFHQRPLKKGRPFSAPYFAVVGDGFSLIHYALKRRLLHSSQSIADILSPAPMLCEQLRSPCDHRRPDLGIPSAFHMDAGLTANFLRQVATSRGVKHILGHISQVKLKETGFIDSVIADSGNELKADLFIDCSGFQGILLNKALGVPFISDSRSLFCDSAVAIPCINNPETEGIKPYTTSTALTAGWVWDVPLYTRNGCGYVYDSTHLSKDEAEQELRMFLGPRSKDAPANHINMRVGRSDCFWKKNCVAVGLSGSFIEPLESTGFFLIEWGLANLVAMFPNANFGEGRIREYNRSVIDMYESTRDFIVMHYALTNREDTDFWKAVRYETYIPQTLEEKLEFFKDGLPIFEERKLTCFPGASYACILDGYRRLPTATLPALELVDYPEEKELFDWDKNGFSEALRELPPHYEYLKDLHRDQRGVTFN